MVSVNGSVCVRCWNRTRAEQLCCGRERARAGSLTTAPTSSRRRHRRRRHAAAHAARAVNAAPRARCPIGTPPSSHIRPILYFHSTTVSPSAALTPPRARGNSFHLVSARRHGRLSRAGAPSQWRSRSPGAPTDVDMPIGWTRRRAASSSRRCGGAEEGCSRSSLSLPRLPRRSFASLSPLPIASEQLAAVATLSRRHRAQCTRTLFAGERRARETEGKKLTHKTSAFNLAPSPNAGPRASPSQGAASSA